MNDYVIGRLRTGAQLIAGYIITWLLESNYAPVGELLDDNRTLFTGLLVLLFTLLWREVVNMIAARYPVAGWLNGYPAELSYTPQTKQAIHNQNADTPDNV